MHRKQWIFDMDGTLTDSMTVVWQGAPLELLRRYGRTARPGIHDVLLSMGMAEGAEYLIRTYDPAPDLRDYEPAMRQVIRDLYKKVELKPGVREMLARLKRGRADVHLLQHLAEQCEEVLTRLASQTLSSSSTPHRREEQSSPRGVPRSPRAAGRQRTRRRRRLRGCRLRHPHRQAMRLLPHRHRG